MPRQTNQLMSRGSHHVPIVVRHNTFILKYFKTKERFFLKKKLMDHT